MIRCGLVVSPTHITYKSSPKLCTEQEPYLTTPFSLIWRPSQNASANPSPNASKRIKTHTSTSLFHLSHPQGDPCPCACPPTCPCCPGRGKTPTVSSPSSPPIVPCGAFCQPVPVAWLTKADWRKGLEPVCWGCSPVAKPDAEVGVGEGKVLLEGVERAKGLVPVGWDWRGIGKGCWGCCC